VERALQLRCASAPYKFPLSPPLFHIPLFSIFLFLSLLPAHAQDLATWRGNWQGLNLSVTVIKRQGTIAEEAKQTQPWWQWGDTEGDAYLFGFGGVKVELVLDFGKLPDRRQQAAIFVLNKDTQPIRTAPGEYRLPEGTAPRMVLQTKDARLGWRVGDQANFDLEGFEYAQDGQPEWDVRVFGQPGLPQWSFQRKRRDPDAKAGYERFGAGIRADPAVPYELAPALHPGFPYLSVAGEIDFFGANRPLWYDPDDQSLYQRWVGFQTAGVFGINSKSFPPKVDFESPFCWYRFDPSSGRVPQLVIRSDTWPGGSPFGPEPYNLPRMARRMSWALGTTSRETNWRYSLTVIGNYAQTDQQVEFRSGGQTELKISSFDYSEMPSQTADKAWKAVTFVEATKGEAGSEGLYDYSVEDNYPVSHWVNGLRDAPPTDFQQPFLEFENPVDPRQLKVGYRGQYSLDYNQVPKMYRSPIDGQMHLLFAQGGLWNLGDRVVLRYLNLDKNGHLDGWVREKVPPPVAVKATPQGAAKTELRALKGEPLEGLWILDGHILYSGARGVEVRKGQPELSDLRLGAVKDRATWEEWVRVANGPGRDPYNLRSWFEPLGGPVVLRQQGRFEDVHVTPTGLRLVWANGASKAVLEYNRRTDIWTQKPGNPPQLLARFEGTFKTFEPGWLKLVLENRGNIDWIGPLLIELKHKSKNQALERYREVRVPGNGRLELEIPWTPQQAGAHPLVVRAGGQEIPARDIQVAPAKPIRGPGAALIGGALSAGWVLLALGIMVVALLAQWRVSRWL
jgi:hypothetical protein